MNTAPQVQWSSRGAFLLAACGAAVGIGSIWRFPYLAGAYGGSAFVALYIIAVGIVVLPVLMAEILIGRRARCGPPEAVAIVTRMESASTVWDVLGWQMIATGFFILSFFSVVSGWIIDYLGMAAVNA
jgi:NSS family neurotransmitter:Na+ symporter